MKQGGDDDLVEVVLDDPGDDAGPYPGATARGPIAPDAARPSRRRRGRVMVAVGAAVALAGTAAVAAAVAATDAAQRRREAERVAVAAALPGAVASLAEPLERLWDLRADMMPLALTDEVLVVAEQSGRPVAQGQDAATGEVRWVRDGRPDEWCRALAPASRPWPPPPTTELVCFVTSDVLQAEGPLALPPTSVVVVDAATGAEVDALPVPGALMGVEPLDDAVLIAWADESGTVLVERWDPGQGVAWRVEAESGLLGRIQDEGMVLQARADVFWFGALDSPGRSLATGEPVPNAGPAPVGLRSGAVQLPDGGWAVWAPTDDGPAGILQTRVLEADGAVRFTVTGEPWRPGTTDGEPADVLVVRTGQVDYAASGPVVGYDARTGEPLWEAGRLAGLVPMVQVGGVVVAAGAGRTLGIDVATGELLWEGRGSGGFADSSVTDGARWLAPTTVDDGPALTAVDVRTGAREWDLILGVTPWWIMALGDRVLVLTPEGGGTVYGVPAGS